MGERFKESKGNQARNGTEARKPVRKPNKTSYSLRIKSDHCSAVRSSLTFPDTHC